MKILILIGIIFLLFAFPYIRIVLFNLFDWIKLTSIDIFQYFYHKSFNGCPCGFIRCYSGLFGQGKTLSAVHYITHLYKRFNGKKVFYKGSIRKNTVIVLSNVDFLTIPFVPLKSIRQIVDFCSRLEEFERGEYCVTFLCLIDEASSQLNSRDFKSNIAPMFLNTLLTSRHYRLAIIYTSQRFLLVDKLLREVTFDVVECRKIGRVQLQNTYSAFDLENSSNITMVKPRKRSGFLIRNSDYNAYDTLACVENLEKNILAGNILSPSEILDSITQENDLESVNLKRRFARKRDRKHK